MGLLNKLVLSLFFACVNFTVIAQSHFQNAVEFQNELNAQYANVDESPLTPEDLKNFKELPFFDIDTQFTVVATLMLTPDDSIFEMATTTERRPKYRRYGILTFAIENDTFYLNVYENQRLKDIPKYETHLFLPFLDETNGFESYGGGRYIDLEKPEEGISELILDFNQSYNPYCAYNGRYSCPIVPLENSLNIEIRAGVKAPEDHH